MVCKVRLLKKISDSFKKKWFIEIKIFKAYSYSRKSFKLIIHMYTKKIHFIFEWH